MIHKDLGVHVPAEWHLGISSDTVVQRVHEEAPHIRIIVVSGEYPDGEKHVLQMGADAYIGPTDVSSEWALSLLRRGAVSLEDQAKRGKELYMPPRPRLWGLERR